jgi:hypothetical protein
MDFYAKIIEFFLLFTNIKQKSATFGFFFTEIFESVGTRQVLDFHQSFYGFLRQNNRFLFVIH